MDLSPHPSLTKTRWILPAGDVPGVSASVSYYSQQLPNPGQAPPWQGSRVAGRGAGDDRSIVPGITGSGHGVDHPEVTGTEKRQLWLETWELGGTEQSDINVVYVRHPPGSPFRHCWMTISRMTCHSAGTIHTHLFTQHFLLTNPDLVVRTTGRWLPCPL